jgi:adenosylcobinamide-GDP ribazoletransferase
MKSLLAAIQFLTICPVPSSFRCSERELRRSVVLFPIVGLLIGGLLAVLSRGLNWLFPPLMASTITVVLMMAVSGCLHMDGLADTADGFLSSRAKERILEIMRDSRSGPMGVIAVVCMLILKVAALTSAPELFRFGIVLLMPLAGRCALVIASSILPYARPQGGLASAFDRPRWPVVTTALLILFIASWLALRMIGLAAAGFAVLLTLIFSFFCKRKIGGFTGDTLGAACELAEIAPALIAASWRWPK